VLHPPCMSTVGVYPLFGPPAVDLLWVIDDSPAMEPIQSALAAAFPSLAAALQTFQMVPRLHVGVISGDLGAGPYELPACSGFGDDGRLQYAARTPGCSPPDGRFIEDQLEADGTRTTNYSGTLADAFNCIAKLGTQGCAYQQPLEAARRALVGEAKTSGFLRDDAYLALVFVGRTDDCSASSVQLFDPADTALGSSSPFRCFENGVKCSPDAPRTAGTKTGCTTRTDSTLVSPLLTYADAFKAVKKDPKNVFVGVIAGDSSPVQVDVTTEPSLLDSCNGGSSSAQPAVRLMELANLFPNRAVTSSSCASDLTGAVVQVAQLLRTVQGSPCLPKDVIEPIMCQVDEVRVPAIDDAELVRELAQCDNAESPEGSTNLPCFAIVDDQRFCSADQSPYRVDLYPRTRPSSDNIWIVVKCLVDRAP
jgi:hypothetical protein